MRLNEALRAEANAVRFDRLSRLSRPAKRKHGRRLPSHRGRCGRCRSVRRSANRIIGEVGVLGCCLYVAMPEDRTNDVQ